MVYQCKIFKFIKRQILLRFNTKYTFINKRFLNFKPTIINNTPGWVRHNDYLHISIQRKHWHFHSSKRSPVLCHSGKPCLALLSVSVVPSTNRKPFPFTWAIYVNVRIREGNENSSCSFPWVIGDVGQVGASNTPEWARPWSSRAWLHTSAGLYLSPGHC